METKIGHISPGKTMFKLTSSGFLAFLPDSVTSSLPSKFYSVKNVKVSTHRNYVEHTMPGRTGSVFQDMGRPAIKIVIDGNFDESGFFTSAGSSPMLSELHKLCDEGKPLDFICDMPILFGIQQVVITDLEATEVRGRKYNYDYKLTLKEYSSMNEDFYKLKLKTYNARRNVDAWKKKGAQVAVVAMAVGVPLAGYHTFKALTK
jgi:hypothetical protein